MDKDKILRKYLFEYDDYMGFVEFGECLCGCIEAQVISEEKQDEIIKKINDILNG